MDIAAYVRVMWRFRLLLAAGLLLAALVAFSSVARIDLGGGTPSFSYRTQEQWLSASTLFVTQDGFPWGRAVLDEVIPVETGTGEPTYVPRFGDGARLSGLAALYAELAKSDAVRREAYRGAGPGEAYEPFVQSLPSGGSLPLIYMKGYGPTPEAAARIANQATDAFRRYLEAEQAQNRITPDKRIEVVVTQTAGSAELFQGRSFARPIFLFAAILMVFVALAFVLENLRPRARPAEVVPAEKFRRSA